MTRTADGLRTFAVLLSLAAAGLGTAAARGDLLYTNPSGTVRTNADGYTIGMRFTVGATPLIVTSLGVWDQDGNGLLAAHDVGLWTDAGALLVSATVPGGTAGALAGGVFRFAPDLASPVTLSPGAVYRLGSLQAAAEPFLEQGAGATYTAYVSGTPISYYGGVGATLIFPVSAGGGINGYLGPNLQFVVPEPAVAALLAASALGLAARRRR